MFWEKIKKKFHNTVEDTVSINNYDINAEMAKLNYEEHQNDLKQRSKDIIKKWNREIIEASNKGKKFLMTNQFVTDDDKDKIIYMLNESNCYVDFPLDATLTHFQRYYENKGFKVVRIEYPTNNICCLKIIWISSDS